MLIQINQLSEIIGGVPLFDTLNFSIQEKDKIGLVGSNGTGKSSLLRLLLGEEKVQTGTISKKKALKIGVIQQNPTFSEKSVRADLLASFGAIARLKEQLESIELQMTTDYTEQLLARYGALQEEFAALDGFSLEDRIITTLKGLGLAEKVDQSLATLSGGERIRVELARILVSDVELMLLDEPTNHLDLAGVRWLEKYLKNTSKAFIVVSHDREFLDNTVQKIIEISDQQLQTYPGNYTIYKKLKKDREAQLQKDYELQQQEIFRLRKLAKQYRQWGNESGNEKFYRKAKEIEHRLERITQLKVPTRVKKRLRKDIQSTAKTPKEVVCVSNLGKILGDKLLFTETNFTIYRGERLAVLGKNGSGKTSFLRLLLGELTPDEGEVKRAENLAVGYLPQQLYFPDEMSRLVDFAKKLTGNEQIAREELARFGFYASDVSKRLRDLSGGEKVRLALLQLFQEKIDLLILDEPTNHLDIEAREEIEAILAAYQGTLLAVSHDRYFLRKNFQKSLRLEDERVEKIDALLLD
ncbi:ribosomal protection-like ABC-F family protein [Lactococcus nasutitermitis]|uniref:Ribosomal protection-like ABC-F family protein n=1 Tax=Lactococcus nasutitermitis TaxID=1652957 RepID=A0ABV9JBK6_9LACT|nr:ABC-F family ATP-binding cassette domain-containing protein [Lactococcus nasutitermitis]